MRTSSLLILLAQLGVTEAGNGKVQGGFRWGDWSEWEPCVRVGKKTRRRRVCFGPIMNKKINKAHCEDNIGGSFSEQQECTQDMINQAGAGLGRMENPITNAQWQAWQEWSRCAGSPPVKKRTRYCGISLRRKVQPNRTCKNLQGAGERTGGRGETNKQTMPCSEDDIQKSQTTLGRTGFNRPNGGAPELSAPECYYPPGTKMVDDVFDDSQPLRIVGGRPSTHGENPHIVMLSYKGFGGYGQFCDGSIIHSRYILTAAHCFVGWDESPTTYEVVVGAYNKVEKSSHQRTYLLESITCHESYKVSSRQIIYDVCILKTSEDIEFNKYVWPICLPDNMPPPNDGSYDKNCTVAGWGDTRFTGDEKILNEVDVPVLTYDTCVNWYEAENILIDPDQHVCAGYEQGGLDACQGDSGGPFVCKRDTTSIMNSKGELGQHTELKVLTGVVSFGVGCALAKNPGVYTNVYHFLDYIHSVVNQHDACSENMCENGGTCIDTYHGYVCECPSTFIGKNCQLHKDSLDACYQNNCSENGSCRVNADGNSYHCLCDTDYAGDRCETLTNPCRITECNNGSCSVVDGQPVCSCSAGYDGGDCSKDINECATGSNDCTDDSICNNTDGGYVCSCGKGFKGDGKVGGSGCTDIDECAERSHNCGSQSVCLNNDGGFACACRDGYVGNPPAVRCQRKKAEPGCQKMTDFMKGFELTWPNGDLKYDVTCGMGDGSFLDAIGIKSLDDSAKHPISTSYRSNDGSNYCKVTCKPGTMLHVPKYAKTSDGLSANVICEAKGKKSVWKPSNKQVRCYGCPPPAGTVLSDCKSKGKKSTLCTAKCANGNPGEWRTRCAKKKGKYLWDALAEKAASECA